MRRYQEETAAPTWQQLTQYNKSNWDDLDGTLSKTTIALQKLGKQHTHCQAMNDMANNVQQFDAAEANLTVLSAQLAHLEFQMETVVYRLDEVKAAEQSLEKAIQLTDVELEQLIALRDAEDAKISPIVDQQIEQAQTALSNAETYVAAQNFRSAIVAQSHVRQLARQTHSTATAEVDKINSLLKQISTLQTHVDETATTVLRDAQEIPDIITTTAVSESAKEAEAQWSLAQIMASQTVNQEDKAWADALEQAIIAYQTAEKTIATAKAHNELAHHKYKQLVAATDKAKQRAQAAIKDAQNARSQSGTGKAGEQALDHAKMTFAQLPITTAMPSKTTLNRIIREAKRIEDRANTAAKLARKAHHKYQARLRSNNNDSSWGSSSSSSSSWGSSNSSSYSSRSSSSSSSSSRSSGSTSSRRRR